MKAFNKCASQSSGHVFDKAGELGYVYSTVGIVEIGQTKNINFDAIRSQRNGISALVEICANFRCISDSNVRDQLIADCCKILDLRLAFNFSTDAAT